jgi:hypothetical protein
MRKEIRINKTWRLLHVDLFIKCQIEKDIMNIKFINFPIMQHRDCEN